MKKFIRPITFISVLLVFACGPSSVRAESIQWTYSYDAALKIAAKYKKPVMAFFYTKWCGWCRKLDAVTFKDALVEDASREFVPLRVDGETDRNIVYRYGVAAYPSIIFLDPSGNVIWREYGFRDATTLSARMREVSAHYKSIATIQPYLGAAFNEVNNGRLDKAISIIDDGIKSYRTDSRLYSARGLINLNKGDLESALADFSQSISMNPKDDSVYIMRGVVYHKKGEFDKALADCDKAIDINKWAYEAYNGRGMIYLEKGDLEAAIKNFNTVILINPKYANAYANRAYAYFLLKDYDKSRKDVNELSRRGYRVNPEFLEKLTKEIDRGKRDSQ